MQELLEKIIEKLNERFENHYSRYNILTDAGMFSEADRMADRMIELDFVRETINQAAAEYNNGWIPCIERLPEEPNENPLFENKHLELYLVTTKYGSNEQDKVYPFRDFWNGVNFTDGWHILDVIAWQPLPPAYKGE